MRPLIPIIAVLLLAACQRQDGGPTTSVSTINTGGPTVKITATQREQPAPVRLTVGQVLLITTESSPRQPWEPATSSNESVLRCASQRIADGAIQATCTGMAPGTATVTTITAPFAGDPHGPPQYNWQLTVTVAGT